MTLRIVGGLFRSRTLKTPKSGKTRPTTSILREALFNICAGSVSQARFLDLFAGSGAIGIEAISRGAAFVTFIEQNRQALECIRENISLLAIESQTQVLPLDARSAIQRLSIPYDLIYVDPPYDYDIAALFRSIVDSNLLIPEGLLFLEERYNAKAPLPTDLHPALQLVESRRYGIAHLHRFKVR